MNPSHNSLKEMNRQVMLSRLLLYAQSFRISFAHIPESAWVFVEWAFSEIVAHALLISMLFDILS